MLKSVDKMRRDVHNIIEDVALKEIEKDPVGFLKREARREADMPLDSAYMSQSGDLWMNMSQENEEFNLNDKEDEEEDEGLAYASQSCDNIVPKLLTQRSPDKDDEEEKKDDKQQYLSKSVKPKKFIDDTILHNESFECNEDVIGSIYKDAYKPNEDVSKSMKIKA